MVATANDTDSSSRGEVLRVSDAQSRSTPRNVNLNHNSRLRSRRLYNLPADRTINKRRTRRKD